MVYNPTIQADHEYFDRCFPRKIFRNGKSTLYSSDQRVALRQDVKRITRIARLFSFDSELECKRTKKTNENDRAVKPWCRIFSNLSLAPLGVYHPCLFFVMFSFRSLALLGNI